MISQTSREYRQISWKRKSKIPPAWNVPKKSNDTIAYSGYSCGKIPMLPHSHRSQEPQCTNTEPSRSLQQPKQLSNTLRNEFKSLVTLWEEETLFTSSLTEIVLNSSYQRIIGMGHQALPFIQDELEIEPNHWSWALRAITGKNPVPPEKQGDIYAERESWLVWMKENLGR